MFMWEIKENDAILVTEYDAWEAEEEEYWTHIWMGPAPMDKDIRAAEGDDARVKANELAHITHHAEYL